MEKWKAAMSSMIEFSKDEDGDHPVVGQFTQQSMSPHTEQIRMFAALTTIGDGAVKINQAVPGYINADNLRDLTGIGLGQ